MLRRTRFAELGYRLDAPECWRIVDLSSGHSIGPHYRTVLELLADLERYAAGFGCAVTTPSQPVNQ